MNWKKRWKINKLKNIPSSLKAVDDLLGFRIIFYLSAEIRNFANLLQDQNGIKITKHNERFGEDDYSATHFIIDFNPF